MEQEKLNIIEKVSVRFLTQGAKTVTMDDVCSILGISKKTLYQYFPTKESLLAEMMSYISEKITNEIILIQKQNINPIEEIFTINHKIYELILSNKDVFMYQLCKFYPEIHKNHCALSNQNMLEFMKSNFNRGIQQGVYRNNFNTELYARFFFTLNFAVKSDELFMKYRENSKILSTQLIGYHLQAILSEQGRKDFNEILTKLNISL